MKKTRKDRTIAEKFELLDRYKTLSHFSQREAAERLGITRGFLQGLLKNEAAIRAAQPFVSGVKRKRSGKDEEVEKALFDWFKFICQNNYPVNGPILMEKANKIAEAAGHIDFKATEGWFGRWKKRYALSFTILKGKAAEADIQRADEFRSTSMKHILETYSPENIYNADETAIYFCALPQSTYVEREHNKKQRGFKTAKDRVTVLVTCNMNGDKEKLLLIGKFKSPRCLRRVGTLPISYTYSKNAWMTATIFDDWLTSWDMLLQRQGRKVALLVDNCSAHKSTTSLKNILLHFLPPNTTSVLQPCEMGIIRSMKGYYRHEMGQKLVDILDDTTETELLAQTVAKRINLLEAMHMIKGAWAKVTDVTIENCWKKGGFTTDESTDVIVPLPPPSVGLSEEDFMNWVSIDDDAQTMQELTEEEFTEELVSTIQDNDNGVVEVSDDDEDYDDEPEEKTPSVAEMRECLRRLVLGLDRTAFQKMDMLYAMKGEVDEHLRKTFPPKQTWLRKFFCAE